MTLAKSFLSQKSWLSHLNSWSEQRPSQTNLFSSLATLNPTTTTTVCSLISYSSCSHRERIRIYMNICANGVRLSRITRAVGVRSCCSGRSCARVSAKKSLRRSGCKILNKRGERWMLMMMKHTHQAESNSKSPRAKKQPLLR